MQNQISKIKNQNQTQKSKPEVKYRAFYLSIDVIKFISSQHQSAAIKIMCDQLIHSITSIGANMIEAKSSSSKREFLNYFQISLKSANETKYWLSMLRELLPEHKNKFDLFLKEADEVSRTIGTSVLTMKGKTRL